MSIPETSKSILSTLCYLMLLSAACTFPGNVSSKGNSDSAHDMACKLAFIFTHASVEFLSDNDILPEKDASLGKKIRSYIASSTSSSLEPSEGQSELSEAFKTAKKFKALLDSGKYYEVGWMMSEGNHQVIKACMFYKMAECRSFANQPFVELNTYLGAVNTLKECGAKLWVKEKGQ